MTKQLAEKVSLLAGKKILIVGDVMLDEHLWSTVNRISQEAPVPVANVQSVTYSPGGAAYAANNIVALGGEVFLVGVTGDDVAGAQLKDILKEKNITDQYLVTTPKRQTTQKTRIIAHGQHIVRVDREDREEVGPELSGKIIENIDKAIEMADGVIISDYDKGVVTSEISQYIINACHAKGKVVAVDPKGEDFSKYKKATIVMPTLKEAETAAKVSYLTEKNLQKIGLKLLTIIESEYLIIARGEGGMDLFYPDKPARHIPAAVKEVFDATGIGDTQICVLTMALAAGLNIQDAADMATAGAGVVSSKSGIAVIEGSELKDALD
ncbi:bifunctional heptose 7-phosphate kinase/heptose 1-phosphate adenyltransferase [Candidatus Margulisiibacteriota bacterium]